MAIHVWCVRLPFSCVSIGFAVGKQVVMGVVYDPYKDELFLAAKVRGGQYPEASPEGEECTHPCLPVALCRARALT